MATAVNGAGRWLASIHIRTFLKMFIGDIRDADVALSTIHEMGKSKMYIQKSGEMKICMIKYN